MASVADPGGGRVCFDLASATAMWLPDERAVTTIGFFHRARVFFAAHGINRLVRVVTDNGANYKAGTFTRTVLETASRHQRIRLHAPRHNGTTRGTTTLLQASDPEHRVELVQQSWQAIRTVVGERVVSWANDELALHYRVEEDDAFFPVCAERDVHVVLADLADALPRMIQTQVRRASPGA